MIKDGKVYRNLEGQVAYLTEYLRANAAAAELGIKVVGQADNISDIPDGEYEYGDAYMIGTEAPFEMCIWTRANGTHPEDYWFNVGNFPMPGPKGDTGLGLDDMTEYWTRLAGRTDEVSYNSANDIWNIIKRGDALIYYGDNIFKQVDWRDQRGIKTDGQIEFDTVPYSTSLSTPTLRIKLSKDLDGSYVALKGSNDVSGVNGQLWVYGGNQGPGATFNGLKALPFVSSTNSLVMFPATGNAADNNTGWANASNAFNTILGKGNVYSTYNTENLTFGGKNVIHNYVQDSATFGYRNEVFANQAMTHGYKNFNYGSESFVQGTENQLLGTITTDQSDGASSDTKASAIIGHKNIIQHGLKQSLVVGNQNTVDSNCQQIITIGQKNKIGKSCNWTNTFGDSNEIKSYSTDSTVFGYQNKVYGGANGNNPVQYVYMLGRNNDNRGPDSTANSNVFLIGEYLNATREQQVVVGCCNKGDASESNAFFVVGTGDLGEPNTPKTTFMVEDGNVKVNGTLTVGSTSITEAQLQSLLALI